MKKGFSFCVLFIFAVFIFAQDGPLHPSPPYGPGTNAVAQEEFRLGVQAYNRFSYNEAILSFERSLSFSPGDAVVLEWLGNAYYRTGSEENALRQWRAALNAYGRSSGQGMLLSSRIEIVSNRRFLLPVADDGARYVETGRYPGRLQDVVYYRQPSSVLPNNDGSVWVVAYGSNELVKIDVNGFIRDRKRGHLNGFDRPYDLVRGIDGRLYVSESRGGRVSILDKDGNWLSYIGSKGKDKGQFIGPQNLTVDEDGYLYVVDYGLRHISKFDPDGAFILSFAEKSAVFPGMLSPTGIAAGGGKIYVADNISKAIYMFDTNGSYLGRLAVQGLKSPESMRFLSEDKLLVADANRILLIEPEAAIIRELGLAGNDKTLVTNANMDINGNILAAKFKDSEVAVMTRSYDIASGLFVQIRNVYAERFPSVVVEFTVEDGLRRPITGLDINNFHLTEGGREPDEKTKIFLAPGYKYAGADISLLVERSQITNNLRNEFSAVSRDIGQAIKEMGNSKIVSVISAGAQPTREQHDPSLENALRGANNVFSPRWRFDLGLRLAASDLLTAAPKRSVVYVGSGNVGELAFESYSLSELSSYLANNSIVFNAVIIGTGQASAAIEYLCRDTGGKISRLYQPQGIGPLIKSVAEIPSGLYSYSFTSALPTDFGRAWLPVEIEVKLMERSGRGNAGYFPPLE
jgi:DNA-binding beta-propeller fold protein YncE